MHGQKIGKESRIVRQDFQGSPSQGPVTAEQEKQTAHDISAPADPAVRRLIFFEFSRAQSLSEFQRLPKTQVQPFTRDGIHASRGVAAQSDVARYTRPSLRVVVNPPRSVLLGTACRTRSASPGNSRHASVIRTRGS